MSEPTWLDLLSLLQLRLAPTQENKDQGPQMDGARHLQPLPCMLSRRKLPNSVCLPAQTSRSKVGNLHASKAHVTFLHRSTSPFYSVCPGLGLFLSSQDTHHVRPPRCAPRLCAAPVHRRGLRGHALGGKVPIWRCAVKPAVLAFWLPSCPLANSRTFYCVVLMLGFFP